MMYSMSVVITSLDTDSKILYSCVCTEVRGDGGAELGIQIRRAHLIKEIDFK